MSVAPVILLSSSYRATVYTGLRLGLYQERTHRSFRLLRDIRFVADSVLLHDAHELLVERSRSLIAACGRVFRAVDLINDFDSRQPERQRIFYNDVVLFIERDVMLGYIFVARLSLDV